MYLLVNLQSLFIGNICKALNFRKVCTKTNFFTGIFRGCFLCCKYFLKLLYFWKYFSCCGACNITKIRIHYRHLRIKKGNVIFSSCIFYMFNSLGLSDVQAKQFIWWIYQHLGKGRWRVIPSCVLMAIHGTFPEEDATYITYNEGDLD